MEHLNHVVSSVPSPRDPAQPQQWVSSQVLLCRRCSHHQTTKIKQLAAFTPREEVSMRACTDGQSQIAVHLLPSPDSRVWGFLLSGSPACPRCDLVTTGKTRWKTRPFRPEGFVPEQREVEALGSGCSFRGSILVSFTSLSCLAWHPGKKIPVPSEAQRCLGERSQE